MEDGSPQVFEMETQEEWVDTWMHVALTYKEGQVKVYLNKKADYIHGLTIARLLCKKQSQVILCTPNDLLPADECTKSYDEILIGPPSKLPILIGRLLNTSSE